MHEPDHRAPRDAASFATRRITFHVGEDELVGLLRVPEGGGGPYGAVILEGPLTSVKEQVAGAYADALAARGFVTLAFDHRHFGESQGEPRQYEHPGRKADDLRAAIGALSALPEVDASRVYAVGVCAGAGYLAPVVADDERIRAFAAVAGFFHDASQQREWMKEGYEAAIEAARAARREYEATGAARMIPAVGKDGDVAMPLAEAFEYYGTSRGAVPNYTNGFAVMSREHTLPWDAQIAAPKLRAPTLMIHAERALAPALARKFFAALGGPKEELWVESDGQIDFYDRPERIEPAADRIADHFRAHLRND